MRFPNHALAACTLLLAIALTAPVQAGDLLEGSGKLETRTLDLAAFTKIDLGGAFDVEVTIGKTPKVELTIDDNLWDNLEAAVEDGTLDLDWKKNCSPSDHCTARITTAALEEFTLHGAGNVGIKGLDGKSLVFYLRGAGDVQLDGKVNDLQIFLTGAGNCDARKLQAQDVAIVLSGVGNCEAYAGRSIDVDITGVGNVTYWGSPEKKTVNVAGMGNVEAK